MDLSELRVEMDEIDAGLVALFQRRMELSAKIAAYKAEKGMAVTDPKREEEKLLAVAAQVSPEFGEDVQELYRLLITLSKGYQNRLLEDRSC